MGSTTGCRRTSRAHVEPAPEAAAKALSTALRWRAEWRAELDGRMTAAAGERVAGTRRVGDGEARRRAKFAEAIARAEFGRAYWDKRLHETGVTRRPRR